MPLANNQFTRRAPKQSPECRRRVAVLYGTHASIFSGPSRRIAAQAASRTFRSAAGGNRLHAADKASHDVIAVQVPRPQHVQCHQGVGRTDLTSVFRGPARDATIATAPSFACDGVGATIQEAPCAAFRNKAATLTRCAAFGRATPACIVLFRPLPRDFGVVDPDGAGAQ